MEAAALFEGKRNTHSVKAFLILSYQTLGVIYGDIGTSPLYTYATLCPEPPSREKVFGITSLIFYTLVWLVCVKYCVIILRARNGNEGGVFALYSLAIQSVSNPTLKAIVTYLAVVGAAMILGDGSMTPAVSIISAVGGIAGFNSNLVNYVVLISALITALLFLCQRFGTSKISHCFSPIMTVWFACLFGIGARNLSIYGGEIFGALNPGYAFTYLFSNGWTSFSLLGAVFLAATGLEALYADIGHFTPNAVRLSWFTIAFPCLIINYFGQGAALLKDPTLNGSPFYYTIPGYAINNSGGFYYFMVVLSTLATVIASQAMISGAFTLSSHAISLGFFPPVVVVNTSKTERGQIYVPVVNYVLLVLTILVIIGFGTNANISNAYGLLVCTVMILTTVLYAVVIKSVWKLHVGYLIAFVFFFLPVDFSFWISSLAKIPQGGWVPIVLAFCFSSVMIVWTAGNKKMTQARELYAAKHSLITKEALVAELPSSGLPRTPGVTIFLSRKSDLVPEVFYQYISHSGGCSEKICFMHVCISHENVVAPENQLRFVEHSSSIVTLEATFGYTQATKIKLEDIVARCLFFTDPIAEEEGGHLEERGEGGGGGGGGVEREASIHLLRPVARTVCVLSERVVVSGNHRSLGKFYLNSFRVMHATTNNPIGSIILNPDDLVEFGKVVVV